MYELVLLRAGRPQLDGQTYTAEQLHEIASNLSNGWPVIDVCDDDKDLPVSVRVLRVYVEDGLLKMEIAIDE